MIIEIDENTVKTVKRAQEIRKEMDALNESSEGWYAKWKELNEELTGHLYYLKWSLVHAIDDAEQK